MMREEGELRRQVLAALDALHDEVCDWMELLHLGKIGEGHMTARMADCPECGVLVGMPVARLLELKA